ncbi:MAG: ketopantoate reductase C-terminal domain-containing protein, partial [Rhodanobacteraceae bacterium]
AIAAANGFPMRPASRERIRAFITNADSTMTASMLKDLERGSRSEGEHVIGDLIARAPASEPAPRLLHIVHAHLRAYEARRVRETAAAA